jgi:hypothetical protein
MLTKEACRLDSAPFVHSCATVFAMSTSELKKRKALCTTTNYLNEGKDKRSIGKNH